MKDVAADIGNWVSEGRQIARATVISTWGSSPRAVGANMAVDEEGNIVGSVSGGCVEGAVVELSQKVLAGQPAQQVHFGVSDDTAWQVGLACGGEIDVFVEPLALNHFEFARQAIAAEQPVASVTVIDGSADWIGRKLSVRGNRGEEVLTDWADGEHKQMAIDLARQGISAGRSERKKLAGFSEPAQDLTVFVEVVPPPPSLIMVGGVHIAVALTEYAKVLGYRTIVVDPRRAFGSEQRFPSVDQLLTEWPEQALDQLNINTSTAVAVLTHDPKIDDPALLTVLPSPAYYVGVLGSRRTHAKRIKRLKEAGMSDELLSRLHAPIGLDIGAQTPEEIALAVMAQIVQARRSGD